MKAKDLLKSILDKSFIKEKIVNDMDGSQIIEKTVIMSNKQGYFLQTLLSRENLIISTTKGQYKKSGNCFEFFVDNKPYRLFEPATWYGDKGFFTLILPSD